jgi:2-dehydro-3-deoxygluconokinase
MLRVACIGECMVELRPEAHGGFGLGFAGDVYNTAVHLKREAPELGVQFLTVAGDDALAGRMREAWRAEGLDTTLAFQGSGTPGLYMIELDDEGQRRFHYWRSASPARQWLDRLRTAGGGDVLAGADLVYLSGISLAILPEPDQSAAIELLEAAKPRIGRLAFDPNVRERLWPSMAKAREVIGRAAGLADILLPSLDDLTALGWRAEDLTGEVAVTAADQGCRVLAHGRWTSLPAEASLVRDTSGAGDAFNGAYLAARLLGQDAPTAARAGLRLAARTICEFGALSPPLEVRQG